MFEAQNKLANKLDSIFQNKSLFQLKISVKVSKTGVEHPFP